MGKKSKKTTKTEATIEEKLSSNSGPEFNKLIWELLDAINVSFPIKDYNDLKQKHQKNSDPLTLFTEGVISNHVNSLLKMWNEQSLKTVPNKLLITLAKRSNQLLIDMTTILNSALSKKILIDPIIIANLIEYARVSYMIAQAIWRLFVVKFNEWATRKLNNEIDFQEKILIEDFDFSQLYDFLNSDFYFITSIEKSLMSLSTLSPDLRKILDFITGAIADLTAECGIKVLFERRNISNELSHPDLEKKLLLECQTRKKFLKKTTYYEVSMRVFLQPETLFRAKDYFRKYQHEQKKAGASKYGVIINLALVNKQIAKQIFMLINQRNIVSIPEKLFLYREGIFYLTNSISILEAFAVTNKAEYEKFGLVNTIIECKQKWLLSKAIIFSFNETQLSDIQSKALSMQLTGINLQSIQDETNLPQDNNALTKLMNEVKQICLEVTVNLPDSTCNIDTTIALSNALLKAQINCAVVAINGVMINKIIIRDLLNTSVTKLNEIFEQLKLSSPKVQANIENNTNLQNTAPSKPVTPEYSPFQPAEEDRLTDTQKNKLKSAKSKKLAEPSLKEQIKNTVAEKKNKLSKKIFFPASNGDPDYVYDENDPDCSVYKLIGDCKRMYIRISDDLHNYLAEKDPNLLTQLKELCKNGTVKTDSKGHTCFILKGTEFTELSAKGLLTFFTQKIESKEQDPKPMVANSEKVDSEENNNNNNATTPVAKTIPVTSKTMTYAKAKIWHEQARAFGTTSVIVCKKTDPKKHYHLLELNALLPTKQTKKNS